MQPQTYSIDDTRARIGMSDEVPLRFMTLLDQHKRILYKVANLYCQKREDRVDLIQEVALALWQSFPKFDGRVQFSTWMYRVAMNVAISFYRGEQRRIRNALPIEDFALDLHAADELMEAASDNLRALHRLLQQLGDVNRLLVVLYLEGYSHDEIAEMIGISSSNVATRINRIKKQLQRED